MRRLLPPLLSSLMLAGCGFYHEPVSRSPAPAVPPPAVSTQGSYQVQAGDTIYSIARQLQVPVRALIDANNLQPPYQLAPGQRLVLPGSASSYVVARGDNLSMIAKRTGVPFATLARLNGLSAPYVLQPGQKLLLPAGKESPLPVAAAVVAAAPAPVVQAPPPVGAAAPQPPVVAAPLPAAPPAIVKPEPAPAPQVASAAPPPPALPPPPARSGHGYVWPVKGEVVAEFGTTGRGQHNDGINIAAPRGAPVIAAESGVVAYAGNELRGFGNLLLIKHEDGWMTAYAHNETLLVKRGDMVKRGQRIALVGDSGGVSQPQLHFELRQGTHAIDPEPILAGKPLPNAADADPG